MDAAQHKTIEVACTPDQCLKPGIGCSPNRAAGIEKDGGAIRVLEQQGPIGAAKIPV